MVILGIMGINSFAQNTPVAIINLYKNEIITKTGFDSKVDIFKKTQGRDLTAAEKKQVLQVLIADVFLAKRLQNRELKFQMMRLCKQLELNLDL